MENSRNIILKAVIGLTICLAVVASIYLIGNKDVIASSKGDQFKKISIDDLCINSLVEDGSKRFVSPYSMM